MSVNFQLDNAAIAAFMRGPEVQGAMKKAAQTIATRAGTGFGSEVRVGTRARGYVHADTPAARKRQAREHVLERAVGGGL